MRIAKTDHTLTYVGCSSAWAMALLAVFSAAIYMKSSVYYQIFYSATLLFCLGAVLGSFSFMFVFRRKKRLSTAPLALGCIFFALGTVVSSLSMPAGLLPMGVVYASHVFMGFGSVVSVVAWGHVVSVFRRGEMEAVLAHCLCAGLCAMIVAVLVLHLVGNFAWNLVHLLFMAASLACFFMLRKSKEACEGGDMAVSSLSNPHLIPKGLLATMALSAFALSYLVSADAPFAQDEGTGFLRLLLALLVSAIPLIALSRRIDRVLSLAAYFKIAMVVLILALACKAYPGSEVDMVADVVGYSAYFATLFCSFVCVAGIVARSGANAAYTFSMCLGFLSLGLLAGFLLPGFELRIPALELELAGTDSAVSFILIAILLLVLAFALDEGKVDERWGIFSKRKVWSLEDTCEALAEQYGLTNRQVEVLRLLVQGKNVREIEKELFVSNGTARTHIRNIYTKLGVHSSSDLMGFVFRFPDK